jgi:hypothetical protein
LAIHLVVFQSKVMSFPPFKRVSDCCCRVFRKDKKQECIVLCNVLRCIAMQLDLFRWRQSPYQRYQVNERSFTAGQSLCQRPRFMCVCAFSITGSGEEQKPCATIRFKRLVPDAGNDFLMHLLILLRHGRVVVVNAQHTDVGV